MFYLQPLGASDYLELSQAFHTVIIRDVPQLDFRLKSQTRRFITLIDTLYDNKVSLHMFYLLFIYNNLNNYKCLYLNKKKFLSGTSCNICSCSTYRTFYPTRR